MAYELILNWVYATPWAILPERGAAILSIVLARARGELVQDPDFRAAARRQPQQAGAVAVLPLHGVIAQRMDLLTQTSGGTSTERFAQQFRTALSDPGVASIVLDIDSPGGAVYGVDELAAEVYRARGQKPIVAIANSLAASAAYWIGTAADELAITPGGEVGGIGVYAAHEDLSKQLEQDGVATTLIAAGKYKTELSPYGPLSEEARAYVQGRVDDYYGMFIGTVARNRGVPVARVRDGFGEGRVVGAGRAVALGMADRVATYDDVIAQAATLARSRARQASALEMRQRRLRLHEQSRGGPTIAAPGSRASDEAAPQHEV